MLLQIPNPCHENWADMSPEAQGRFCQSCQKTVIDFSEMNDKQVAIYFEQSNQENICGRFNALQINRNLSSTVQIIRPNRHPAWKYMLWSVLAMGSLTSIQEAYTQKTQGQAQVQKHLLGEPVSLPAQTTTIKGVIFDGDNEISDAIITLIHTDISVTSDANGHFEFQLPADWGTKNMDLLIEANNYEAIHKTIKAKEFGNLIVINLKNVEKAPVRVPAHPPVLMGKVAYPYPKN